MGQKYIIIVTAPKLESFTTFKGFCLDKKLSYQTLANNQQTPKIGEPVTIGDYTVHKVECK